MKEGKRGKKDDVNSCGGMQLLSVGVSRTSKQNPSLAGTGFPPSKKKVKNKVDWKSRISFGLSTCLVLFFLATYMRKVSSALKWPIDSQCPSQNKKPAYPCPSDLYKTYTKPHLRIDTMNVAPPKTPRYAMSCSTLMHLLQNTRL